MDGAEMDGALAGFAVVGQVLEEDGWEAQRLPEGYVYRVGFSGENGQMACFAQVRVDLAQFLFYVVAPVKAPAAVRPAVAEYVTRANYGLRIGNFELNYGDGEVRYKSSIDFEGVALSPPLIRHVIYPAVQTMDRYLPGLLRVIYGDVPPTEAIGTVEKQEGAP